MDPVAVGALAASVVLPALAWLLTDARSKGRAEAQAEKQRERDKRLDTLECKVAELDKQSAVDHQAVNRFGNRLDELRADMDKRFDRIEALLVKGRGA